MPLQAQMIEFDAFYGCSSLQIIEIDGEKKF